MSRLSRQIDSATGTRLTADQLKGFPHSVKTVLLEAVNHHGVMHRMMDANHIRLYTGDRKDIPMKVSASRKAEYTLRRLVPWLDEHFQSYADRDRKVTADDLAALAETLNTNPKTQHQPTHRKETEVPALAKREWTDYVNASGKHYGFETDGVVFRCKEPGCDHVQDSSQGQHLHQARHTGAMKDLIAKSVAVRTANRKAKIQKEARATATRERAEAKIAEHYERTEKNAVADAGPLPVETELVSAQQKVMVVEALRVVAEHIGATISDSNELESLRQQVTELRAERDEAQAKLALIQEAMRA